MPIRENVSAAAVVGLYLGLSVATVTDVGRVGEVATGWTPGPPPAVLVNLDPPLWAAGDQAPSAGHRFGPLVASQTRPIERFELGPVSLPLAINAYTGGPPDWPARTAVATTGTDHAATVVHVLGGAFLVLWLHRFLLTHAGLAAATAGGAVLASQWSFVFYRKVLGGTELVLLAAALLAIQTAWTHRWAGLKRPYLWLGAALGIGILAKLPFVLTAGALGAALVLTHRDRPDRTVPRASGLGWGLLALTTLTAPLWITALHHGLFVPEHPHIRSHDFPQVQWRRVLDVFSGGSAPVREQGGNIVSWAIQPLSFFELAYGGAPLSRPSAGAVVGWGVLAVGAALSWWRRPPSPGAALTRLVSVLLVLQVAALGFVARDLHHLAQAAPTLALAAGLAADRLARLRAPTPGLRRTLLACLCVLPFVISGTATLWATDTAVSSIPVATFTRPGQQQLRDWLEDAAIERLVVCDYESYGLMERLLPDAEVVHGWGAASRRYSESDVNATFLPDLVRLAAGASGGHLLVMRSSAPMIYNLRATDRQLSEAAASVGLHIEPVGELPAQDGKTPAARLFAVTSGR